LWLLSFFIGKVGDIMSEQIPSWAVEIKQSIARIEEKLESYGNIREKAENADHLSKTNKEKIENLEDNQMWLWRTVGSGLILGALGLLFFIARATVV
jgi:ABC-type hemin transport system substrate-binding protein